MNVEMLLTHEKNPQPRHIRVATEIIEKGGIALIPTETGYCFVGDAKLESTRKAFLSLREAHPTKKPFSILCKDIAQASHCACINTAIYRIAARVFPGPFTFILEVNRNTPKFAGGPKRKTVGVRISAHPITRDLIQCFGSPLLVTSVTDLEELHAQEYFENLAEDATNAWWVDAEKICEKFKNQINIALAVPNAVPMRISSIIDFTQTPATVIRDGGWGLSEFGILE